MQIDFSRRARREALEIDAWWRGNRLAAPRLFRAEMAQALRLMAIAPHAGRRVEGVRRADTRVLVLPRTRYLLFYRILDDAQIRLLSVRHGHRAADPSI